MSSAELMVLPQLAKPMFWLAFACPHPSPSPTPAPPPRLRTQGRESWGFAGPAAQAEHNWQSGTALI
jgi:hypothetical protein